MILVSGVKGPVVEPGPRRRPAEPQIVGSNPTRPAIDILSPFWRNSMILWGAWYHTGGSRAYKLGKDGGLRLVPLFGEFADLSVSGLGDNYGRISGLSQGSHQPLVLSRPKGFGSSEDLLEVK